MREGTVTVENKAEVLSGVGCSESRVTTPPHNVKFPDNSMTFP